MPILADFAVLVNVFFMSDSDNELPAAWRGTGPRPTMNEKRLPPAHRSAGACPPRSINRNEKRPSLQGFRRFLSHPQHGEGQALALR